MGPNRAAHEGLASAARAPGRGWGWLKLAGLLAFGAAFVARPGLASDVWATLTAADGRLLGLGFAALLFTLWIGSLRFLILVRASGHAMPARLAYRDLLQAVGLNAVLLMGAGDLLRVRHVDQHVGDLVESSAFVALDRLLGLAAFGAAGVLALGAMTLAGTPIGLGISLGWVAGGLSLLAAAAASMVASGRLDGVLTRLSPVLRTVRRPGVVARLAAISALTCLGTIVAAWLIARSVHIDVGVSVFLYATPLVTLATLAPISVGGVGVREMGYAFFLAPLGVPLEAVVALGLSQYAAFLGAGALGFAWTALGQGRPRRLGEARDVDAHLPAAHEGPEPTSMPQERPQPRFF